MSLSCETTDANPLAPESDEEASGAAESPAKEADGKPKKKDAAKKNAVRIDFDGLDQRIIALPVGSAVHSNLRTGLAGEVYYIKRDRNGSTSLANFSLKKRAASTLMEGASRFAVTPNGKKLIYLAGTTLGNRRHRTQDRPRLRQTGRRSDPSSHRPACRVATDLRRSVADQPRLLLRPQYARRRLAGDAQKSTSLCSRTALPGAISTAS